MHFGVDSSTALRACNRRAAQVSENIAAVIIATVRADGDSLRVTARHPSPRTNTPSPVSPSLPSPLTIPRGSLSAPVPRPTSTCPTSVSKADTYTVLLSGNDTNGRFCLIDMIIPPGGGPLPHRHDFEESFILLDGEIEATFRGEKLVVRAGETLHIPSNAPHSFKNASGQTTRLLCLCAPAGQEEFFAQVGVSVATRTTTPPQLDHAAQAAAKEKAESLAPRYRTEFIKPGPIAAIMQALG